MPQSSSGLATVLLEPHRFFARDRQHVGLAVLLETLPQRPIVAVDRIAGDPRQDDTSSERALQHLLHQGRFGRKNAGIRNPSAAAALPIVSPLGRQREFSVARSRSRRSSGSQSARPSKCSKAIGILVTADLGKLPTIFTFSRA